MPVMGGIGTIAATTGAVNGALPAGTTHCDVLAGAPARMTMAAAARTSIARGVVRADLFSLARWRSEPTKLAANHADPDCIPIATLREFSNCTMNPRRLGCPTSEAAMFGITQGHLSLYATNGERKQVNRAERMRVLAVMETSRLPRKSTPSLCFR